MITYLQSKDIKITDWALDASSSYYKAEYELIGEKDRMLNVYKYLSDTGEYVSINIDYTHVPQNPTQLYLYSKFPFIGKLQYATNIANYLKYYEIKTTDWTYNSDTGKYVFTLPIKGTPLGIESPTDTLTVRIPGTVNYQPFILKGNTSPMILVSNGGNYILDVTETYKHELILNSISPFQGKLAYLAKMN